MTDYSEIPKFEPGSVVTLKSDLQCKVPMTVVHDEIIEQEEIKQLENIDWLYAAQHPDMETTEKTGRILKRREIKCKWFNTQRIIKIGIFKPEQLNRLEPN